MTRPLTKDAVLKVLSGIVDPDLGRDIVSLGFVKEVSITGNCVRVTIELTTPACPVKEQFRRQAEDNIKALGAERVDVELTAQEPRRAMAAARSPEASLANINAVVAVSSCKGGVGKSTVAAHIAVELGRRGQRVGLLDADLHGPSLPSLFELAHASVHADGQNRLIPLTACGIKLMSFGFLIKGAPAVMRGPLVSRYLQQLIFGTVWGELDFLIIDMPPGTGDIQLTLTQTVALSGTVIVTTPHTLSLVDVARGILMFEKVNVPMLGVVENMADFICPHCGQTTPVFGKSAEDLERRFGLKRLGRLPLDPEWTRPLTNADTARTQPIMNEIVESMIRELGKTRAAMKDRIETWFDDRHLHIRWPDGEVSRFDHRWLRLNCRCALCVDELSGRSLLDEKTVPPDVRVVEARLLGHYAVGVRFSDGHASSIYPLRFLKEHTAAAMKA